MTEDRKKQLATELGSFVFTDDFDAFRKWRESLTDEENVFVHELCEGAKRLKNTSLLVRYR